MIFSFVFSVVSDKIFGIYDLKVVVYRRDVIIWWNEMLPNSDNLTVLKSVFYVICNKIHIPESKINRMWKYRLYGRYRTRDKKYQFYNTNYVIDLLKIFELLEDKYQFIKNTNENLVKLYLIFKYAWFNAIPSGQANNECKKVLEEFLNTATVKYKTKLIKEAKSLSSSRSKLGSFIYKLENYYFSEHPEIFRTMCDDIEFDWCRRTDRKKFFILRSDIYYNFIEDSQEMYKLLFDNYHHVRAVYNVKRANSIVVAELKLYHRSSRELKLKERKAILKGVVK